MKNFQVKDVTFHGGRKQSEILNEIDSEVGHVSDMSDVEDKVIPEVVSVETLKDFCFNVLKATPVSNQKKRRVYAGLLDMIEENIKLKEENRKYLMKELKGELEEPLEKTDEKDNIE